MCLPRGSSGLELRDLCRDTVQDRSGIQFRIDPELVHRLKGSNAEVLYDLIFRSRFLENGSHSGGAMAEPLWLTYEDIYV